MQVFDRLEPPNPLLDLEKHPFAKLARGVMIASEYFLVKCFQGYPVVSSG